MKDITTVPDDYIVTHCKTDIANVLNNDESVVYEVQTENVPLIRCKDCKHYHDGDCDEMPKLVGDDDYCSFGERKDT